MSIPGRNEICHCGSGKKYKKCCLEKDAAPTPFVTPDQVLLDDWDPEENESGYDGQEEEEGYFDETGDENEEEDEEDFDEDEDNSAEDTDDDYHSGIDVDSKNESISDKDYPVISREDQERVNRWWKEVDFNNGPEVIKKHIESFMNTHPQLVENLGLENEVLFELGGAYRRTGNINEFIQFLLFIRKEFPQTYIRSAGYYDSDIIAWLIVENRQTEIEEYTGYFKQYPIDFMEQLFEVINLLKATDNIDPLMSLVSATSRKIAGSDEVLAGNEIFIPIIAQTVPRFLQAGCTDKDISRFLDDLSGQIAPVQLDKSDETISEWKSIFDNILRPFECWPDDIPNKKSALKNRYAAIGQNFRRYLHERTGISWVSAWYYAESITNYFLKNISLTNGKIKKQFDFSEKNMDRTIAALAESMIWLDCTIALSTLNAIYHFASYIQVCGNISDQEKLTIQNDCTQLYENVYPNLKMDYTVADCFRLFPLFPELAL